MFERARALQRDSGYSIQWCEDRAPPGDEFIRRIHAILLIEDSTPVGVVSFAWMRWTDGTPHGWRMLMAWIAEPWLWPEGVAEQRSDCEPVNKATQRRGVLTPPPTRGRKDD